MCSRPYLFLEVVQKELLPLVSIDGLVFEPLHMSSQVALHPCTMHVQYEGLPLVINIDC